MMLSAERLAASLEELSYPELIRERNIMIGCLKDFEKKVMSGDRSDPDWNHPPTPEDLCLIYHEYLEALFRIMREKFIIEYVREARKV